MPSAPYELVPLVKEWVGQIVSAAYPDDAAAWGVSLQMLPDPTQEEAWLPVLAIYIELPVVGENSYYGVLMLPPFRIEKEQVRAELEQALADLSDRREAYRKLEAEGKTDEPS